MTILVGVLCKEGVIIGSDSSSTLSAVNSNTIEQPAQKTFVVGNDLIFATTGPAGLGQRLHFILHQMRTNPETKWHASHHQPIAQWISTSMIKNMDQTYLKPGNLGALLAFACGDSFHLCEFGVVDFQPQIKDSGSWFVSMGSGQSITDPFFGLLRRTLFRDSQPNLAEGVAAAYWALHNTIDLNTGGIKGPVQLAELRRSSKDQSFEARLLDEDELAEHERTVERIENDLACYRKRLATTSNNTDALPEPSEKL